MAFSNGLVIGKFAPYHKGHRQLLKYALGACENLHVVIVHRPGRYPYRMFEPEIRAYWIMSDFCDANVSVYIPSIAPEFDDIDDLKWADLVKGEVYTPIDAHFSFEYDRDKGFAKALGAAFVRPPWDLKVSATQIREDPYRWFDEIPVLVQNYIRRTRPEHDIIH